MRGVLSQSLLPPLFSYSTPSKRSVDSTSPNQRPVRRLSGLLSRGRSNLATSLRQTDEKPDKSTLSLILFPHICTRIFFFPSLSLPAPFSPSLSLLLSHSLFSLPPPFCLSLAPSCRRGEQPQIMSALLSPASSEPLSSKRTFARVRRTAGKNDNFSWSPRVMRALIRRAPVLAHGVGISWLLRGTDPVWLVAANINAFVKRFDADNISPLEQKNLLSSSVAHLES